MRILIIFYLLQLPFFAYCQKNCNIYTEGSNEKKACELYNEALNTTQGSDESQILFDKIIALNPNLSDAYAEKSVPYFKRGFLLEGLKILNKAVEIDPVSHLCYRAYWYFQYRNYAMCVKDLEDYYALPKSYNQLTPGGDTDMRVLLAMSYAKLGDVERGIQILRSHIDSEDFDEDYFFTDYHRLGVLYFENHDYKNALVYFNQQLKVNPDFADTYYYAGLTQKALSNVEESKKMFQKSLEIFNSYNRLPNFYLSYRVYKLDVERELGKLISY